VKGSWGELMRFLRSLIIGLLSIFPGTILGYLGWLATGASNDNYSPGVIFFCNVVPFGFVIIGFLWAWASGEEYGVKIHG